jgi:hypothetical protein
MLKSLDTLMREGCQQIQGKQCGDWQGQKCYIGGFYRAGKAEAQAAITAVIETEAERDYQQLGHD